MRYSDPNRPTPGANHKDPASKPDLKVGTGNAALDGYTVLARRPRVGSITETVSPERADRIEDVFGPSNDLGY